MTDHFKKISIDIIYFIVALINIIVIFYFIQSDFNQVERGQSELIDRFIQWLRSSAILFLCLINAVLFLMVINQKKFVRSLRFNSGFFEDLFLFCMGAMPILAKYWIIIGSLGLSIFFSDFVFFNYSFKFEKINIFYFIPIAVVTILSISVIGYFSHRLMHKSIIWPLHRIHHESKSFNILTKFRFNPFELIIIIPIGFFFFLNLDGFLVVKLYYSWRLFHEIVIHSHYPWRFTSFLRFIIVSANDHRNHQSRDIQLLGGQNFSVDFIFWDRLFGTYKISQSNFFPIGINNFSKSGRSILFCLIYDLWDFLIRLLRWIFVKTLK